MRSRLGQIALVAAALALLAPATAAAAAPPRGFFGVIPQGGLSFADYARLGDAQVGSLRVEFNWAAVQRGNGACLADGTGSCDWGAIDGLVYNASAAGIRVFPTFFGSPPFISKHHNNAPTKGSDLKNWRQFVGAAAARYGRNGSFWQNGGGYGTPVNFLPITDWQLWNEPNSKQFWHGNPQPKAYGKLVKASSSAIRQQDSKAKIVLAGMFGYAKQPLVSFLNDLYKVKGIEKSFDSLAIHPYSPTVAGVKKQVLQALRTARRNGDRKAGIQMTELGWTSSKGSHPLDKGKQGQAKILKQSFRLLIRKRGKWHIDSIIWFAYNDTNLDTCRFCKNAGLVNVNGKPKPAWRAFTGFTK